MAWWPSRKTTTRNPAAAAVASAVKTKADVAAGGEPQANTRANGTKGGNKAAASDKPKRERGGRNRKEGGRGGNNAKSSQSSRRSRKGGGRKVDNEGTYGNVALYTGFDAGQPQLGMQTTTMTEEPTPTFEVVKADDKMELLADANDSPTLKPTAKEFAPSQAALAAAAARAANGGSSVSSDEERDEDGGDDFNDGDDDEDNDGLGFDPTQDMDGLMMSGDHHDDEDSDAALDFDALNLTDPISFPTKDGDDEPRHIFAFGSSGTWGGAGKQQVGLGQRAIGDDSCHFGRIVWIFRQFSGQQQRRKGVRWTCALPQHSGCW